MPMGQSVRHGAMDSDCTSNICLQDICRAAAADPTLCGNAPSKLVMCLLCVAAIEVVLEVGCLGAGRG